MGVGKISKNLKFYLPVKNRSKKNLKNEIYYPLSVKSKRILPIPTQPKPKIAHISQKKKKQDEEQFVFMKCVVPSQRNPLEHTFANQINILTQHMVDFPY